MSDGIVPYRRPRAILLRDLVHGELFTALDHRRR
jgi:hypothetical protein